MLWQSLDNDNNQIDNNIHVTTITNLLLLFVAMITVMKNIVKAIMIMKKYNSNGNSNNKNDSEDNCNSDYDNSNDYGGDDFNSYDKD